MIDNNLLLLLLISIPPELRRQVGERAAARTGPEGGNASSGFVTFKRRCDAEFALRLDGVSSDDREFVISAAPAPDDVLWADLARGPAGKGLAVKGYLALAGLYLAYLPLVVGVTNVGKSVEPKTGFSNPMVYHFPQFPSIFIKQLQTTVPNQKAYFFRWDI